MIPHYKEIIYFPQQTIETQMMIKNFKLRNIKEWIFKIFLWSSLLTVISILMFLLLSIIEHGYSYLTWNFLTHFPSRFPSQSGIKSALYGTMSVITITALVSIPIGIASAIFLEEYPFSKKMKSLIDLNIGNLAGVPSIIYGILGLAVFVRYFALERSLLSGGLILALLVLPVIIKSSQEAIKAVPNSIREAAASLGVTRWQIIMHHILPQAIPGISTGIILALGRAMGETAPLIMIGALTFIAFTPESLFDPFTTLPIQIFNWTSKPQPAFHDLAAAGIMVLLGFLFFTNAIAILIRYKTSQKRNNAC